MKLENIVTESAPKSTVGIYDIATSLFQQDTLAPQQFLDTFRRTLPNQPEMRLVLAILEDAINCYQDNLFADNRKRKQLFQEAEEWFFSDDASWIFSFVSVCDLLNVDPNYFRQGLTRWASRRREAARKVHARAENMPDRLVA